MRARLAVVVLLAAIAGCTAPTPQQPALRLSRVSFSALPGWGYADQALASFQRSCAVLMAKPESTAMGGSGYAGTVGDWRLVCSDAKGDARAFFEKNFTPFAAGGSDALFTGYYEPQIRG